MTTLAITPNWKNKTAKFKGTIAAGEHVAVTIQNDNGEGDEYIEDTTNLRLRVVNPANGKTLAQFPMPVAEGGTSEEWDSDLSPLSCTLNLNTVQMLMAVPPMSNVPLLFVLDAYREDNEDTPAVDESEFTLYFKDMCEVTHWPRRVGEEQPVNLDDYKDIIADFREDIYGEGGFKDRVEAAEASAAAAATSANNANTGAWKAAGNAQTSENEAKNAATEAKKWANNGEDGDTPGATNNAKYYATQASDSAADAQTAAASINDPDATLTEEGVAADAKATGDKIAAEKLRAETAEAAEETRAKGVESGLRTDLTAAQEAIDDEAILRVAADADLNANKADKATTYTKSEVDAKIAGVQTFKKYVVNELPDPEEADMKGLYLVPTGETSEQGDLCDEYTVVGEVGSKRWERIGGATVDISSKQDKLYTQESGWDFSTESVGSEIAAFMADAANYSVTEEQSESAWLYTLTGYDEDQYYVAPVGTASQSTSVSFSVLDVAQTSEYGSVLAEYSAAQTDIPAQVDTTPTASSGRLVTSGGVYEATADAVKYVTDHQGNKTAVTIGTRAEGVAPRKNSLSVGRNNTTGNEGLAVGEDNVGSGAQSVVAGENNTASGEDSAAIGDSCSATDKGSVALGRNAEAHRKGEVAVGVSNVSRYNSPGGGRPNNFTRFSVGIGNNSGTIHKNAFEIDEAGQVRVLGIGGYDGELLDPNDPTDLIGDDLATVVNGKQDALTFDNTPTAGSNNPVTSGGIKDALDLKATITDLTSANPAIIPMLAQYAYSTSSATFATTAHVMEDNQDNTRTADVMFAQIDSKLDATSAAPAFSTSSTYAVGEHVTYNGALYVCSTAVTTAGAWNAANWTAETMTDLARYAMPTSTPLPSISEEVIDGETITIGELSLADRTANRTSVTTALDELRIEIPAAVSGKLRDFGLRVEVGTGSAELTAPALVPVAQSGETITFENPDGAIPALADGTATAKGVTLLYFSETSQGVFVVKGEQVQEVA